MKTFEIITETRGGGSYETYLAVGTFKVNRRGKKTFVRKDYPKNDKRIKTDIEYFGIRGNAESGTSVIMDVPIGYPLAIVLIGKGSKVGDETLYDPNANDPPPSPLARFSISELEEELKLRGFELHICSKEIQE